MNWRSSVLTTSLFVLLPILASRAVETANTQALRVNASATQLDPSEEVRHQSQRFSREQWGLNEKEWGRYNALMQGIRGSISQPNLSPIEVLGIHAETEAERHDYAKKLAKLIKEDTERVLAFTRAYQAEADLITPNKSIINPAVNAVSGGPAMLASDRVLFFTRLGDCIQCRHQLNALLEATHKTDTQLDIYLVDAASDSDIVSWAKKQPIEPSRLSNKTITLNHDQGTLVKVAGITGTAPKALLIRNGQYQGIDDLAHN